MDSLWDLAILLFFIFPIIGRILGGRKKPRQVDPELAEDSGAVDTDQESAFQRAIREIEAALENAGQEPGETSEPVEARQPVRRQPRPKPVRRMEEPEPFHEQVAGSFEHKDFNEFRDQTTPNFLGADFNEFRELTPVTFDESLFSGFDPIKTERKAGTNRIRKKLRGKRAIRDAFVTAEILGPPYSQRKRNGPRHF